MKQGVKRVLSTAPFRLREEKEKLGHNAVCFSAQLTSTGKARAELSAVVLCERQGFECV